LRVLVVDDNLDAAITLKMLVEEAGHWVQMAHTGPTALAAALDYRPDVMLLDIGLPELDGFEVAERIHQESTLRDIVLVAVTGHRQAAERKRIQEAGFHHYLVKPADFDKVREILAAVAQKAT
jgi:CheY-like chemotaxis protein